MYILKSIFGLSFLSLLSAALPACSSTGTTTPDLATTPDLGSASDLAAAPDMTTLMSKGVYTMSNDATDNRIYAYARAADGTLTALSSYSTGGRGTGAALGDQNGLIFDATQSLFFVVNAGDNSISMLSLKSDGSLALLSKIASGGIQPVSITNYQNTVYVVNAGDVTNAANISGFQINGTGLSAIAGSTKPLSAASAGPAQIQFTPSGKLLVVSEKATSMISTYTVTAGVASAPMAQASKGMTPFGFAFSANQQLVVSEAAGGGANMGSTSSYSIGQTGTLTAVSSKVASNQTAPCWVAVAGSYAYVDNANTNNITGYKIAADGTLTLLGNGVSATAGMGTIDNDVTDDNSFLYVLNGKDHTIGYYAINADGSLTRKQDFAGIPAAAAGLIAR